MKKVTIFTAIFLTVLLGLGITGCYKDIILPDVAVDPDGPPQAVSYKTDLAPLFNTKCATAYFPLIFFSNDDHPFAQTQVSCLPRYIC